MYRTLKIRNFWCSNFNLTTKTSTSSDYKKNPSGPTFLIECQIVFNLINVLI